MHSWKRNSSCRRKSWNFGKKGFKLIQFTPLNIENCEENRRAYRELLFQSEGIENYISGVILFDETARQSTKDGKRFIDLLKEKGIAIGIKVDQGLQVLPGTNDENWTAGLDTLAQRAKEYYDMGN